ncbi:acetyl esterase/lipase [Pontibacter ummariensis]|uniref:Acetyl esterase/lipase n=1 Tax=Pontibacter ummariensis TaxID=1610492 RepID=A0A239HCP9_9BACT|nr:alpha/beta hydrolase [Pontibacter ummariensis]PRY10656.1 acetyl esterase/lipase [Pontibacter ummariensis]SNS78935.1 Acetyl esterase/lipase [Pontibacter ummariensis]
MKSFTYYLTLLVIKLKGLKREFSKDPIDYRKLRQEDVHTPNSKAFRPHQLEQFKVAETLVTEIRTPHSNGHLIIFCHGGAFVYGPARHHWDAARRLVSTTGCTLWMVDYPKAPEHKIDVISQNIDQVYAKALTQYDAGSVTLLGDSVGGTLVTSLTQRLVEGKVARPSQLLLISPVMDAAVSNPEIEQVDKIDPMLSKAGVLSAKSMCALNGNLEDPRISPIKGDFTSFPRVVMFLAENDITYPDQKIAVQKMGDARVDVKVIVGKGLPHIWPILPVMQEGRIAFREMVNEINQQDYP